MKSKRIENWFSEKTCRVNRESPGQMYFTSQRKLLELKRNLKKNCQNREQALASER